MIDAEAVIVSIQKSCLICKLYVFHSYISLASAHGQYISNTTFIYRANGDKILVSNKIKYSIKVGDVVSFAIIANKKLHRTYIHKITRVRADLLWQDVVNRYLLQLNNFKS